MENEVLLKAIERLLDKKLDEKLEPIKQDIINIKSEISDVRSEISDVRSEISDINFRISKIESTQQTILKFVEEVDKEFYKVEETYRFMNNLKKAINE